MDLAMDQNFIEISMVILLIVILTVSIYFLFYTYIPTILVNMSHLFFYMNPSLKK